MPVTGDAAAAAVAAAAAAAAAATKAAAAAAVPTPVSSALSVAPVQIPPVGQATPAASLATTTPHGDWEVDRGSGAIDFAEMAAAAADAGSEEDDPTPAAAAAVAGVHVPGSVEGPGTGAATEVAKVVMT